MTEGYTLEDSLDDMQFCSALVGKIRLYEDLIDKTNPTGMELQYLVCELEEQKDLYQFFSGREYISNHNR